MLRILFFGMSGRFSLPPLEKLLAAGFDLAALITSTGAARPGSPPRRLRPPPAAPSDLPILNPHLEPNILHLAWRGRIPVWQVGSLSDPATQEMLSGLQPDLVVVACFPRKFPPELLSLPRLGCLNLHPSLLPAHRGPAPLFWQARNGAEQAGVTLHFLDEGLDSGDIVAQKKLSWPEGSPGAELEQRCAKVGAELLLAALEQLAQGQALPRYPQPSAGASYFPWPGEADFLVPLTWSARRAFNFLRAALPEWPLRIVGAGEQFLIRVVVGYDPDQILGRPYLVQDDELWVQFRPGVLRVKS